MQFTDQSAQELDVKEKSTTGMEPSHRANKGKKHAQRDEQQEAGLPDLRRFRALQMQHQAKHLKTLTSAQLGITDVTDLHHISRMKARDGTSIFRVRICKTCSKLQHLIELGSYKRLEPAILVHDAHELVHHRVHKLRVLTADDRPFLYLLTLSNHGRAVNLERIPVIDILVDRINRYYVARGFVGLTSISPDNIGTTSENLSRQPPALTSLDSQYSDVQQAVNSLREMRTHAAKSEHVNNTVVPAIHSPLNNNLLNFEEVFTYHAAPLSMMYLAFGLVESLVDAQRDTDHFADILLGRQVEKLQAFEPTSSLPASVWKLIATCYVPVETAQLTPLIQQLDVLPDQQGEEACLSSLAEHLQALLSAENEAIPQHIDAACSSTQELIGYVFTTAYHMRLPSWMFADLPTARGQGGYIACLAEMFRHVKKRIKHLLRAMDYLNQSLSADAHADKIEYVGNDSSIDERVRTAPLASETRHRLLRVRQRLTSFISWDILQCNQMALYLDLAERTEQTYAALAFEISRSYDALNGGDAAIGSVKFTRAASDLCLYVQKCKLLRMVSHPHSSVQEMRKKYLTLQLRLLETCADMMLNGRGMGINFRTSDAIPSGDAFLADQDEILAVCKAVTDELGVPMSPALETLAMPPLYVVLNITHAFTRSIREWIEHTNCLPYLSSSYSAMYTVGHVSESFLAQGAFQERQEQLQEMFECALGTLSACGDRFKIADFLWKMLRDRPLFNRHFVNTTVPQPQKRARVIQSDHLPQPDHAMPSSPIVRLTHLPLTNALAHISDQPIPHLTANTIRNLIPSNGSTATLLSTRQQRFQQSDSNPATPHALATKSVPIEPCGELRATNQHQEIAYEYTDEEIKELEYIFDV